MEIKFQTKEESKQQQQDDFLKLSKVERVYIHWKLILNSKKLPIKNEIKNNNFEIFINSK